MKKLITVFLLCATIAFAQAATGTATFTFTTNGNAAGVEYFVEQKQGTAFVEVAKGTASPIVLTVLNPVAGTVLTYRLRARLPGNAASTSAPTPELTATVPVNTPGNFNLVFAFPTS